MKCRITPVINTEDDINPSVLVCLSVLGSQWLRRLFQMSLLPENTFQLLLGDPDVFPGQMRCIISPESSGSAPGLLPVGPARKNLQREAPMRRPVIRGLNHLSSTKTHIDV